jgi:hypothetical protein
MSKASPWALPGLPGEFGKRGIDLGLIAREERDVGAFAGEDLEDFEANAAGPAVHDDFLALETQIHRALHP